MLLKMHKLYTVRLQRQPSPPLCVVAAAAAAAGARVTVSCSGAVWSPPRARWCCLTPHDPGLLLGNRATADLRLSRAELCTAQHRWCQSANLSGGIGGWTLVRNIWCYPGWKPSEAEREKQGEESEPPSWAPILFCFHVLERGCCRLPAWRERVRRAAERVQLVTPQRSCRRLQLSLTLIDNQTHALSPEWGSGPEP